MITDPAPRLRMRGLIDMVMKEYKTFKDLDFKPWMDLHNKFAHMPMDYYDAKQAWVDFDNGYSVSVLLGKIFYSNGRNTYELAIFKGDKIVYPKQVCPDDDVLAHLTKDEVTEVMKIVQDL